jgi:hypothetical protein
VLPCKKFSSSSALLSEERSVVPREVESVGEGVEAAHIGVVEVLFAGLVGGIAEEDAASERPGGVDRTSARDEEAAAAFGRQVRLAVSGDDERPLDLAGIEAVIVSPEVAAFPARTTLNAQTSQVRLHLVVDRLELSQGCLGDGLGKGHGLAME